MNTLFIYDTSGFILFNGFGDVREPIGTPFLWVEVPSDKRVFSIDVSVTPNVPIFEDIPKTELEIADERISMTEEAINTLIMLMM